MPSRAWKTAPGQKDASGKIKKSHQPETFPEMIISKLVYLFSFSWVHTFPGGSCLAQGAWQGHLEWVPSCCLQSWAHGSQHLASCSMAGLDSARHAVD